MRYGSLHDSDREKASKANNSATSQMSSNSDEQPEHEHELELHSELGSELEYQDTPDRVHTRHKILVLAQDLHCLFQLAFKDGILSGLLNSSDKEVEDRIGYTSFLNWRNTLQISEDYRSGGDMFLRLITIGSAQAAEDVIRSSDVPEDVFISKLRDRMDLVKEFTVYMQQSELYEFLANRHYDAEKKKENGKDIHLQEELFVKNMKEHVGKLFEGHLSPDRSGLRNSGDASKMSQTAKRYRRRLLYRRHQQNCVSFRLVLSVKENSIRPCFEVFYTKGMLELHLKKDHEADVDGLFGCSLCSAKWSAGVDQERILGTHIQAHLDAIYKEAYSLTMSPPRIGFFQRLGAEVFRRY
ncbi:hypothetical protein BJ508DRAFT_310722 [Ascobolus immersus RN42]|uniref:Uncharacterized protein n=1 Tax=Ascobolus immersus RN42 TaxID=1160509 RepID=A0A3N4HSV1_ASCIM|nr:hypothetical protein BJ508DRAFT_310722 [Ascobolus immersus RN42]